MKEDVVSIIIPMFNESKSIIYLIEEINKTFENISQFQVELVFVDDGSTDDTVDMLKSVECKNYSSIIIKLSKNCGSHSAIRAGLTKAKGNFVILLTSDLQDPPSLTIRLYGKLKNGFDIVWAQRKTTRSGLIEKLFSEFYSYLMRKMALPNYPKKGFDVVMFNRKVKDELNKNIEANSSIYLQILGLGFKQSFIDYDKGERKEGKSKWTLSRKLKLFVDSFTAFSFTPIRFVTYTGIGFSMLGFIWTFYIISREIFLNDLSPGWPALVSILMIGFGVTNISLGIIAEYLWRTLDAARNRPVFIIEECIELKQQSY